MTNTELIEKFYTSFAKGDVEAMKDCYHDNVVFEDAAFGKLNGERASKMWEMLLSGKAGSVKIDFHNVDANSETGKANWKAEYRFGEKRRQVVNHVQANFRFKDGKIIEHRDSFDFWKWTQQALGPVGYLLGWTPFMKNKIQKTTNRKLDDFIGKKNLSVYPVPARNVLHIEGIDLNTQQVELLNANGQTVLKHEIEKPSTEIRLDVSNLNSGVYFLKVSGDRQREIVKIIVEER